MPKEIPTPKTASECHDLPWRELGHFHELAVLVDGEILVNKHLADILDEVLCDN